MTQTVINYARVLYELQIPDEIIMEAETYFRNVPELKDALTNPVIPLNEKYAVIEDLFTDQMKNFLKMVCKNGRMRQIREIFEVYETYSKSQRKILQATLIYVTEPTKEQEEKFKVFLKERYGCRDVELKLLEDRELIGGFVLRAGEREFDWSIRLTIKQLEQKLIRR